MRDGEGFGRVVAPKVSSAMRSKPFWCGLKKRGMFLLIELPDV
jgi:hypothetical protein